MASTNNVQGAALPANERERKRALDDLQVLDTAPEAAYDDLAWLAADACDVPIALVSLIDSERQWFKARCGIEVDETPRELSFCAHAILQADILEVPDAREDARFADHPAVLGEPHIRFYAGAPLVGRDGYVYGALCVADSRAKRLSARQREVLTRLGRQVVAHLEARRSRALADESQQALATLLEAIPDAVISCDRDGRLTQFNGTARDWHGVDPRTLPRGEWSRHFEIQDVSGAHAVEAGATPLVRARNGEDMRDAAIVIRAAGQAPRTVLCNAQRLLTPEGESRGAVCVMRDVTELEEATSALTLEKARLQAIVDASLDVAIIATDPHGVLTLFNPGAEELLGYAADEVIGTATPHLFHLAGELDDEARRIERLTGRRPTRFVDFVDAPADARARTRAWTFVRRDGERRHVRFPVTPVRAPDGTISGYLGMAVDLTEQIAAETKAQLAAGRFSGAFSAAAQGMALVGLDGRWIDVNDALCEILGYSRSELLATDFQKLTHPDDLETDLQLVHDVIEGRRASYVLGKRYFHKNGQTVWARLAVSLVRGSDGEPLHFVSQIQDVTDQHRAEERLRESEARVRNILDHSHDAFIAMDDAGLVVEWNHSAEATFGWSRSEAVGRLMSDLIIPERLRDAHGHGLRRFLLTGERRVLDQRIQLPAVNRIGQEFPVELTISEIHSGGRRLFCAFLQDITLRVASEERVRESEARLRLIADNLPVCISYVDADLHFGFANQAHAEWIGRRPAAIEGLHLGDVLGPERYEEIRPLIARVLSGETVELQRDFSLPGGGIRHAQGIYIPDVRNEIVHGFYAMWHDITPHRKLAQVLEQRALRDELTGLPNRAAWTEELARAAAHAQRAGTGLAVMFMDLDAFKQVNDEHGHDAGDAVLRAFADVLRNSLRRNDYVARLGGDEFVVLLDCVSDPETDPPLIARKILDRVAAGVAFEGLTLPMQPSIGAAIQAHCAIDPETIVRCADEAMYRAKRDASTRFVLVHC